MSSTRSYTTRPLSPDTWDDFAALVEANNGVWGGCWCMGFHAEGLSKESAAANRNFISAAEMTPEEAAEFPHVVGRLEGALRSAFNFDKINYVCLMMVDRHYHFHVYPRYETPRIYDGVEYIDEAWPRPVSIAVPPSDEAFLIKLRDHLRTHLPQ